MSSYLQNQKLSAAQVLHLNFSFSNQAAPLAFYEKQLYRKLQTQVIENRELIRADSIYHIRQILLAMKYEGFDNCLRIVLNNSYCKIKSCFAMFHGEAKH